MTTPATPPAEATQAAPKGAPIFAVTTYGLNRAIDMIFQQCGPDLGPTRLAVYLGMLRLCYLIDKKAHHFAASQFRIAGIAHVCRATVQRAIHDLVACNLVEVTPGGRAGRKMEVSTFTLKPIRGASVPLKATGACSSEIHGPWVPATGSSRCSREDVGKRGGAIAQPPAPFSDQAEKKKRSTRRKPRSGEGTPLLTGGGLDAPPTQGPSPSGLDGEGKDGGNQADQAAIEYLDGVFK